MIYVDLRNEDENDMILESNEKSLDYLCIESTRRRR